MTGASVLVRRNAWTLAPGEHVIDEYAAAVATMRARHPSDPTSWDYQAAMHGVQVPASQSLPLYNGCQHRTWFFLPWHRMFLYFFERIVRAAVVANGGSDQWALPFWDYEGAGQQPRLPLAFRPNSSTAPLHMTRAVAVNNGQALASTVTSSGHARSCQAFVGRTEFGGGITGVAQFSGQEGQLEIQPHDAVHVAVGGKHGAMANILAAAQDPIFWLHHANIDRLWWVWSAGHHPTPGDPRWIGQTFSFFDEHGQKVSKTPADVLDIERQLGYTYESAAPPVPAGPRSFAVSSQGDFAQAPQTEPVGASTAAVTLTGVPVSAELTVDERAAAAFLAAHNETQPEHIDLELAEIEGAENPGTIYGVYLNLPDGASPETAEAHHAATLSFFGIERAMRPVRDEPAHPMSMTRDITTLLAQLAQQGVWDGQHLQVTFRPLDPAPADPGGAHALPDALTASDPAVTVGSIRILYR